MAIPLPVPAPQHHPRSIMSGHSPKSSAQHGLYSPFSSSTSLSPQYGNSCALTILKGHAQHPINAHAPIHHKHNPSTASHPSRFAASFTSLRSASKALPTGFDSSVNVHTLSDHGILLPFLDRPSEVKELIFDTKANEALMYRLCRVFGGNPDRPLLRGQDERWDEMLELLIELDRPLLDDEDWLVRLESLVMERSPELWAQLARCLGAEGLTLRSLGQPSSSRFDSWALSSQYSDPACDNDSPLSSAVSSQDDQGAARDQESLSVSVEPLEELPQSYSEQPAGKLQNSTLHEAASPSPSPSFLAPDFAARRSSDPLGSQASFNGDLFPMSASGGEDSAMTGSLEDIMEEPCSSTDANPPSALRRRSQSGKFAGLRISALSSSSPAASRRTSTASDTLSAAGQRESSSSPLATGAMSPASLAPMSPVVSPSPDTSTSFSKHRRLSTMIKHNNITHPQQEQQQQQQQQQQQHQQQQHHHHHNHRRSSDFDMGASASPKSLVSHRRRGVSEAGHSVCARSSDSKPRRRAESFARSFAELKSPSEHLEQLRAEHAKVEADRLAEHTRRISLKDTTAASAPAAPTTGGLGLHGDCAGSSLLDPSSASLMDAKAQRPSIGRIRVGSLGSTGSTSPPIPGLLPDGRTRHPSGSCGSRDLSESIAAFRATMGLSISPSPSERHYFDADDGCSDAGKSTDSATRKRKGSSGAELPKPTWKTTDTAEAKISRKASPTNTEEQQKAQFEQPKHMQELESRNKASGASGSGLALGGGFSLAKSGANFRGQSHDSTPCTQSVWRSSFARRDVTRPRGGEPYSYRSPPAVHRRPGGFVSLAQEYERARHGRRASESVFSIHSNALDSSPSSSIAGSDIAGFDGATGGRNHRRSSEERVPRLELSLAGHGHGDEGKMSKSATTADIVKGDPTPKAGPATWGGGITPRASFASCSSHLAGGDQQQGYPFPKLLSRVAAPLASEDVKMMEAGAARGKETRLSPATPLSPLEACTSHLSPPPSAGGKSGQRSPRSPSIVFPISSNASISRARELQKALETPRCQTALQRIGCITNPSTADSIRELISSTERSHMPDETLLEEVACRLGLVDHEKARSVGGRDAEDADIVLAEEGYAEKWEAFADLCKSLGVGAYELSMAKRRCGPAIDLCGQRSPEVKGCK
ncbi:hypothetical protein NDA14_002349 [Ustilago hordei]|uniref:Uncharacterized protein n=1 Tax=Ustilago hordei TaxID=120017 RepID=I2FUA2_USTHO|nr:uncharacterized protein UHO2_04910 [Ustilago hordei]KAJ1597730.1 hypothetical protein NDA14_002349 [Ustilago hordei]CCF50495.1 uncharacterized protein UHOR_05671 [Ustilago hordei]SYW82993.1 uncharacterized protein UHO2_04910 [Ustilago hordei]